jgi:hypothetical protein
MCICTRRTLHEECCRKPCDGESGTKDVIVMLAFIVDLAHTSRPNPMSRGFQSSAGSANNRQAHLATAYQELGNELGSAALKVVGGYTLGRVIGEGPSLVAR